MKNAEKDCFIVVAQIGDGATVTAWTLKNANALPVAQRGFVKIVDDSGILWE